MRVVCGFLYYPCALVVHDYKLDVACFTFDALVCVALHMLISSTVDNDCIIAKRIHSVFAVETLVYVEGWG